MGRVGKTYGTPRIQAELVVSTTNSGRTRGARLKRAAHRSGYHRWRHHDTTRRDRRPHRPRIASITAITTHAGFLYLAVVSDVGSRRIVGWSMAAHLRSDLVLAALEMALWTWRPAPGVVHHSDHGSQHTSVAFTTRCQHDGIHLSMGTVGECYNNAITASFVATLECELLTSHTFRPPDSPP